MFFNYFGMGLVQIVSHLSINSLFVTLIFYASTTMQKSYSMMFMTRFVGRTLFAAAKSETPVASAAAAATTRSGHNPLEEFFEPDRSQDEDKPVVYGTILFIFIFTNRVQPSLH